MKRIFIALLLIFVFPSMSYGHSGRTDSNGGHYNRSTGQYHNHNSAGVKQSISSYKYILSIFHNKQFQEFGNIYNSKKECMRVRYRRWKENGDTGWRYGCRKV